MVEIWTSLCTNGSE